MADDSFIHMVDGYLEDKLDKDDLKKFLAMLENSRENREILARNAVISRLIETSKRDPVSAEQIMMALPRHGDTAKLIIDQIRNTEPPVIAPITNKPKQSLKQKNQRKQTREARKPGLRMHSETPAMVYFFRTITAVAACALIGFSVWRHIQQTTHSIGPSIGLINGQGDILLKRGDMPIPVKSSTAVHNGDVILVGLQAMAVLHYNNEDTILKIQEGSLITLDNKNKAKNVFLKKGVVIASVAPQPKDTPMTLTTPKACATVLGTKLALKSTEVSTHLDVIQGKVRIARNMDNSTTEVSTGNRIEVNDNTPLTIQPVQAMVIGHLAEKQIEEMFETITTARAFGINTLTFDVSSMNRDALPKDLRTAIATAHRANIKFFAKLDIPKNIGSNHEDLKNQLNSRLAQLVMDYNFDGIYVTRPPEMIDENYFKLTMRDIHRAADNSGVPIETGVRRAVSKNDTWFIGY
ncbi:MAG: hypothetical protein A2283_19935 [Lentisphaerae bacterium RIFOXYA12_FULL_48_11]|nr:MAG: hypothetical protein A2283_19935 [Lentisphaerae bacterium RIFOXYA12_FULL_48_11]